MFHNNDLEKLEVHRDYDYFAGVARPPECRLGLGSGSSTERVRAHSVRRRHKVTQAGITRNHVSRVITVAVGVGVDTLLHQ